MMVRAEPGPAVVVNEWARRRLAEALDREPVVAAYLFGSQATGRTGPLSDVDVAVWLAREEHGLRTHLELASLAAGALGTDAVDLVVLDDAGPLLTQRVLEDGVLLVDRDPVERVRRHARAIVEFLDTQPLRDELDAGLRHALEERTYGRRRRRR